jgi:hypothetical protein
VITTDIYNKLVKNLFKEQDLFTVDDIKNKEIISLFEGKNINELNQNPALKKYIICSNLGCNKEFYNYCDNYCSLCLACYQKYSKTKKCLTCNEIIPCLCCKKNEGNLIPFNKEPHL